MTAKITNSPNPQTTTIETEAASAESTAVNPESSEQIQAENSQQIRTSIKEHATEMAAMQDLTGRLLHLDLDTQLPRNRPELSQPPVLSFHQYQQGPNILLQNTAPQSPAQTAIANDISDAIAKNDLQKVKTLVNAATIDAKDGQLGRTPLMHAAHSGNVAIMNFLIQNGAKIDETTSGKETALMLAAQSGKDKVIDVLMQNKADANLRDAGGKTALFMAAEKDDAKVIDALLKNRPGITPANPDLAATDKKTPLMEAAGKGNSAAITALVAGGADLNLKDSQDRTALMEAAKAGNSKIVQTLIDNYADVSMKDNAGTTALMEAASSGNAETTKALLAKITHPDYAFMKDRLLNEQGIKGRTALFEAVRKGNKEVVKSLINAGIDVNLPADQGKSPLIQVAETSGRKFPDKKEIVTALINAKNPKINLDLQDDEGKTALMKAAEIGDVDTVKALVNNGARVGLNDKSNQTALQIAEAILDTEKKRGGSMQQDFQDIVNALKGGKP